MKTIRSEWHQRMNRFWSHLNADLTASNHFGVVRLPPERVSARIVLPEKSSIFDTAGPGVRKITIRVRQIQDDRTFKATISIKHICLICHENFTTTEQIKKLQKITWIESTEHMLRWQKEKKNFLHILVLSQSQVFHRPGSRTRKSTDSNNHTRLSKPSYRIEQMLFQF